MIKKSHHLFLENLGAPKKNLLPGAGNPRDATDGELKQWSQTKNKKVLNRPLEISKLSKKNLANLSLQPQDQVIQGWRNGFETGDTTFSLYPQCGVQTKYFHKFG